MKKTTRFSIENNIIAIIAILLLSFFFTYLIVGQIIFPSDRNPKNLSAEQLNDFLLEDSENIEIPYNIDGYSKGEEVKIFTTLKNYSDDYNMLMIWSNGQSVEVKVEGETIYNFNIDECKGVGIDAPYLYLFAQLPYNCSGKQLEIIYTSKLDGDAGAIGEVYIGEKASLIINKVKDYQFEVILAIFVFLLGLISLVVSLALYIVTKLDVSIFYLGLSVIIISFWILANCQIRQFIFPNVSIIRDCAFLILPLMPLSFGLYLDRIQKRRYHKMYFVIEIVSIIDFVVLAVCDFLHIAALSEMYIGSMILIAAIIISFIIGLIIDIVNNKFKQYKLAAIGLFIFGIAAIIQLSLYVFLKQLVGTGVITAIGLILLVVFSLFNSVKIIGRIDDEKEDAVEKVELMSKDALQALAKTVDAKDRYTAGHSQRVAEYSCLIAKELGWNKKQIEELRFQGLMHDIGKIAIPDTVLNKPGKLSDIEFHIIQSHAAAGGDILKNVTALPGVDVAARNHHERYDGVGYPDRLRGNEIPINARIIGIADAYDAMNSDRVYRKALPFDVIRKEILNGKGTQFDPYLVDVFIKMLDDGKVKTLNKEKAFIDRKIDEGFDSIAFSSDVDVILEEMKEKGEYEGALIVEIEQFTKLLEYMANLEERYNHSFELVVISLKARDEHMINYEQTKKAAECMEIAIKKSIRNVDICTKYSECQFLAILFEADSESIYDIVQRIFVDFYKLCDASEFDVEYKVADLS